MASNDKTTLIQICSLEVFEEKLNRKVLKTRFLLVEELLQFFGFKVSQAELVLLLLPLDVQLSLALLLLLLVAALLSFGDALPTLARDQLLTRRGHLKPWKFRNSN